MGRKVSHKSGFQWAKGKPPDPSVLGKLVPNVREGAAKRLIELAPTIVQTMVDRIKGGQIARDGKPAPIPDYSKAYKEYLVKAGVTPYPDLTVTGTLLDHLSAKVRVLDVTTLQLTVVPYGRVGHAAEVLRKRAEGVRPTEYVRPAYSYTTKSGKLVNVAATTIKNGPPRPPKPGSEAAGYMQKTPVYNAHLATYLSMRLGGGSWKPGGKPPSSFLTLLAGELINIRMYLIGNAYPICREIIRDLAN